MPFSKPEFLSAPLYGQALAFVRTELEAQKGRLFLWLPFFLACGIGVYFALPLELPFLLPLMVWLALLSVTVLVWGALDPEGTSGFVLRSVLMICVVISTGFLTAQWHTKSVYTPVLQKKLGPVDVVGTIEAIEDFGDSEGVRVILSGLQVEDLAQADTPRKVRLRLRAEGNIRVGQRIKALAMLHSPSRPVVPGGFDFRRYLYFQGIGAVGFIFRAPEVLQDSAGGIRHIIETFRHGIAQRIEQSMSYPEAGIAMALMIGRRGAIADEDQQAMRDAGLAHMLAISGLHVGLVAGAIFFAARFMLALVPALALGHPIKKYAAGVAMLAAFIYMLLAGATVPTQRAMMMTGVVLLAVMLDRSAISIRLVAFAAAVILFFFPESLTGASFQLSFAAVTALVLFYDALRSRLSGWYRRADFVKRCALYFLGIVITTLVASTAIAPFALYHFQHMAVYDLPANIMAGPVMAFVIMPFAIISFLLMPFGLEALPLSVMGAGISGVLEVAHSVSSWPMATYNPPAWPFATLLLGVIGAYVLAMWKGRLRYIGLGIAAAGVMLIGGQAPYSLLVSDTGKLMAVYDGRSLSVSQGRSEKFVRENWARYYGVAEEAVKVWPQEGAQGAVTCGEQGCRIALDGTKLSVIYHRKELPEACAWADVILSPVPLPERQCPQAKIIDMFDMRDNGTHGLRFGEGRFVVETAAGLRGDRTWE